MTFNYIGYLDIHNFCVCYSSKKKKKLLCMLAEVAAKKQNYLVPKQYIAASCQALLSLCFPTSKTSKPQLEWRCRPQFAFQLHQPLTPFWNLSQTLFWVILSLQDHACLWKEEPLSPPKHLYQLLKNQSWRIFMSAELSRYIKPVKFC